MSLLAFARSEVVTIAPEASVRAAAQRMSKHKVGCLVVVYEAKPVGLLTDRDIVIRVLAQERGAEDTPVEAVMSRPLITLDEEQGLFEALSYVTGQGLRRFPVISPAGTLSGLLTLTDVLHLLSFELSALGRMLEPSGPPRPDAAWLPGKRA